MKSALKQRNTCYIPLATQRDEKKLRNWRRHGRKKDEINPVNFRVEGKKLAQPNAKDILYIVG